MTKSNNNLWVHVVWNTKYSREYFNQSLWKNYLNKLFFEISDEYKIQLYVVNGYTNHVHALIRLRGTQNIAAIVKYLKGKSSKMINEELGINHFNWQNGYYSCSVSPDRVKKVENYILNQWTKHSNQKLKDELKYFAFEDF
ncbi:IS200/IS605 family transposase [Flammeovirga pacifica]|uniref:Transposase IS200-like domain-containing protein n=1 Tax=Flammeovirga pacifica TaxID=915059 RepID=A0A1S1YVN9_FLAPC|nr:IS200/IS605 family transposase [Flammeovirga pacifica]OHX65094.1 hypothetical protein NH26_01370 [Flammeovirga pacifica]